MRLVCISDTHNAHRSLQLPEGDVLIHAGDATGQGLSAEVERFLDWFAVQPHPHKLLIAGNHDWLFQRHPDQAAQMLEARPAITYLQDSGVEIEGVRFWGSPWQPWFFDWAFNLPRNGADLREAWSRIPLGTDVLITHGPPHGMRDQVHEGEHLGCEELRIRLGAIRPRVHVFGHIHDAYGVTQSARTTFVNACSCDESYRLLHKPVVLDLTYQRTMVHEIESNDRLARLLEIQKDLEDAQQVDRVLQAMAEIRERTVEELDREYARRGLHADLVKLLRAESKPNRRPIPFTRWDGEWP